MTIELSPDYYLKNFNTMLDFVIKQYADLIIENEWAFIKSYQKLNDDAAKLFVRLCLRQKSIYVSEQLEEEAQARTILDKLHLIDGDKGGLYMFDRDLERANIQPPTNTAN